MAAKPILFVLAMALATSCSISTAEAFRADRLDGNHSYLPAPLAQADDGRCLITEAGCQPRLEYLYSQGDGSTVVDTSGHSSSGHLTAGATWVSGKMGTAIQFDGLGGTLNAGSPEALDNLPNGSFSGEAWIRIPAQPASKQSIYWGIFHKAGERGRDGWLFNLNWNAKTQTHQLYFAQGMKGRDSEDSADVPVVPEKWHHVAFSYEGSTKTVEFFFDGKAVPSQESVSGNGDYAGDASNDLVIGYYRTKSIPFSLDSTRIYAYRRSAEQVARSALVANVKEFGAVGDGKAFDQAAFLAAAEYVNLNGGGIVYVPAGTYLLDKVGGTRSTVQLHSVSHIAFAGDGERSVLRLNPQGGYGEHGDTHVFQLLQTDSISFGDLRIEGSKDAYSYHDEQMHGIYILNSRDTRIDRVTFSEMRGDGVYVIGDNEVACPAAPCFTEDVYVGHSYFWNNGRSGIANQGGIRRITYEHSNFDLTSDQDIDFEPSGNRPGPEDVVIRSNVLNHSNGAFALTLGGTNASQARRFTVTDNYITGAVMIYKMHGIEFSGNTIAIPPERRQRALTIQHLTDNISVHDNSISANADYVVYAVYPDTSNVSIENNVVSQHGRGVGVQLWVTKDNFVVKSNTIYGPGGTAGISAFIVDDQIYRTDYHIVNNSIFDFAQGIAIKTRNSETRYDVMSIIDNVWHIPAGSLTPNTKPVVFQTGNNDDAPVEDVVINPTVSGNIILEE